mmetsp:Transcript_16008/g.37959  ORF Transcript_16008/g.37959 Transcript_16008/m.37959 type:complete len:102 (-) Transcript_16008:135-440(-)
MLPERRIGISPLKRAEGRLRWKITAADVPGSTMRNLLEVYEFGQLWDGQLSTLARWVKSRPALRQWSAAAVARAVEISGCKHCRDSKKEGLSQAQSGRFKE